MIHARHHDQRVELLRFSGPIIRTTLPFYHTMCGDWVVEDKLQETQLTRVGKREFEMPELTCEECILMRFHHEAVAAHQGPNTRS